jgi:hypothetical protein
VAALVNDQHSPREAADTSCQKVKAIDSKSDVAPIVAVCQPNPNAQSTSEAG